MSDQTFTYNEGQNLTANGFSKVGYTFVGWAKLSDGVVVYTNGQSVNNLTAEPNGEVNLYAKWTVNTHTVTYDMNGHGTQVSPDTVNYGESIPQPEVTAE
jgi:uncharacterized repeat protein (TIGR02543 family)